HLFGCSQQNFLIVSVGAHSVCAKWVLLGPSDSGFRRFSFWWLLGRCNRNCRNKACQQCQCSHWSSSSPPNVNVAVNHRCRIIFSSALFRSPFCPLKEATDATHFLQTHPAVSLARLPEMTFSPAISERIVGNTSITRSEKVCP